MIKYIITAAFIASLTACSTSDSTSDKNEAADAPVQVATTPVNQQDTILVVATGANMSEMKFDVKTIKVPAGKQLTIALKNESTDATMPHNFAIIQAGTANDVGQSGLNFKDNAYIDPANKNVIAHSPLAQINETVYFTFSTPTAGEYEFICSYPGHWGMMNGKFIVE
jgi:azurin